MPNEIIIDTCDGHTLHPPLQRIHRDLVNRGYALREIDEDEEGICSFSAPHFGGYEREIAFWPRATDDGRYGFKVSLMITSCRQRQVREIVELNRCYESLRFGSISASENPTIVHVSLHWLMQRWKPFVPSGQEPFLIWDNLAATQFEEAAHQVQHFLEHQGIAFFNMVDHPKKLISTLENLENFPGTELGPGGPTSSDRSEFIAVLLKDIGQGSAALRAMENDVQSIRERVAAGVIHPDAEALAECKIERYKSWLLSS